MSALPPPALPLLFFAAWLALNPALARAWDFTEWGLGAWAHSDIDIKGGNLQGLGVSLNVAGLIWSEAEFRLDFRLEGGVAKFWNYASGLEASLVPGLRLYFPALGPWPARPFLEGGLGPSWDHLVIEELGSELNFLSFGGLGLRLPMAGWHLELGYRLRHISNGGLEERNHGVTSNVLQLALAWDIE